MLHIDEATVRRLLPMEKAVALLEQAFADWGEGRAQNQPRRRMRMPSGAVLHSLAGANEKYFGTKVYSTHAKHGAWFHFLLYDAQTGRPLALFDANWLGQIRTGAASGVATKWLAREDASTVAVLGSGFQAASQLEAVRAVRKVDRAFVWSRTRAKAEAFANTHNAVVCESANEAVAQAGIVITMTSAKDPLFDDSAITPGTHINAAGSNIANRAEVPAALVHRADVVAVDSIEQARIEAGDLLLADIDWSRVVEMKDRPVRSNASAITLFKSIGLGLEDVAAAAHVYEAIIAGR
ncbi:MAG: ornithine cyclodeaminase family protein [Acidobacteria bacterium]|nr:ornithine cyclodeaminase family protein [Acidobacteriota bacterium]